MGCSADANPKTTSGYCPVRLPYWARLESKEDMRATGDVFGPFPARGAPAKHTAQRGGWGEGKSRVIMRINGFYSIFCPHSQGLSPQKKRWLGKTGATFTACSPWKTIQFRHWYTSHIIKAVSDSGSPAGKTQAVRCPHKVRTSPAYSSGVQPPFPKPAPRENVLFELGSNRVNMRGMYKADELWYKGARNEPVYSLNEFIRLSFNQALPRGELFYHQFSQLYMLWIRGE